MWKIFEKANFEKNKFFWKRQISHPRIRFEKRKKSRWKKRQDNVETLYYIGYITLGLVNRVVSTIINFLQEASEEVKNIDIQLNNEIHKIETVVSKFKILKKICMFILNSSPYH